MKLTVERLQDTHDCETCGMSWANGFRVTLDGNVIVDLKPSAHCFGGNNYGEQRLLFAVLDHLGYEVEGLDVYPD